MDIVKEALKCSIAVLAEEGQYFEKENNFWGGEEKDNVKNIWRRKLFVLLRRRGTYKEKEENIWR